MWVWGALFAAVLVFEMITLYLNRKADDGTRRNLTAYVQAYFGIGNRRLKRSARPWIMAVFLGWLLLHFLGYV